MLPSLRSRAKSRLNSGQILNRAASRLTNNPKHQSLFQAVKVRRLIHNLSNNLHFIKQLKVFRISAPNLNFPALGLSLLGWASTYVLLTRVSPATMSSWPTMATYWPVVVLAGWNLFWLVQGLGNSLKFSYAIALSITWWLWLRFQYVETNLRLTMIMIVLAVIAYLYIRAGEKYLFSRKSIRKGILR